MTAKHLFQHLQMGSMCWDPSQQKALVEEQEGEGEGEGEEVLKQQAILQIVMLLVDLRKEQQLKKKKKKSFVHNRYKIKI